MLSTLLEDGDIRLKRGDQVARLRALQAAVVGDMENALQNERIAGYNYSELKSIRQTTGVVTGLFSKTNKDLAGIISNALLGHPTAGEPTFGTVLVRIGPGDVPDDVRVVSISRLARESHRKESEVIAEIQKAEYRLLTEKKFTGLISWLAEEILTGRLNLPFKPQPTIEIRVSLR